MLGMGLILPLVLSLVIQEFSFCLKESYGLRNTSFPMGLRDKNFGQVMLPMLTMEPYFFGRRGSRSFDNHQQDSSKFNSII